MSLAINLIFLALALLCVHVSAVSDSFYNSQRSNANDLARLLKRPLQQRQTDYEGDDIYYDDSYVTQSASDAAVNQELEELRLEDKLARDRASLSEPVNNAETASAALQDVETLAAAEKLFQEIETAIAGMPTEEANRVALAYLLDVFDLGMQQPQFDALVDQINKFENAYTSLADTLNNLRVE